MKTSQAVRNIRKYIRKIETAPKGRMVTDDYGNKLSVKKKPDGTFGRRHTLSRGKERAFRLSRTPTEGRTPSVTDIGRKRIRHARSDERRKNINYAHTVKTATNTYKRDYHRARLFAMGDPTKVSTDTKARAVKQSSTTAKAIHGTKRKSKDFTK